MTDTPRAPELAPLDVLVGDWDVQVDFPDAPTGRASFSWDVEGRYLVQRSGVPDSPVPSTLAVIAADGDGFLQHYFDSRGVVRLYRMTLRDDELIMLRTEPDFSPLDFAQRFVGRFDPDGSTLTARWETSHDGGTTWEKDFDLEYRRVT